MSTTDTRAREDLLLNAYLKEREKRQAVQEAEEFSASLRLFTRAAWDVLKPAETYKHNWHIDAITDHLEAVSRGEIRYLQIWVPRGTMKSMNVSIIWPAWEWTRNPGLRYWSASYELGLAGRLAAKNLYLMEHPWYQARWGHLFGFLTTAKHDFSNDRGGTRLATAPQSTGLGEHGHRIIIDDPINALAADATSRVRLNETNDWYDATVEGSKADPEGAAEVIIMQRLHEDDLAGHAYDANPEDWTILCLPERYEASHPFVWPADPREENELLWPTRRSAKTSERMAKRLGAHRSAGQMQQRPSAKEGEILKRHWWRFYHPKLFHDERMKKRRPGFTIVVQSIDTPLKDKQSNDLVAIQAWGVRGADRYLLDLKKGHMNYGQARRAILEQARYVRRLVPRAAHHVLIEGAGYGTDLYDELRRELTGLHKIGHTREGDKILRAESAASDLESGNCFLPGHRSGPDELSSPDDVRNAADVTDFIDSCALFPNGRHDDDVDAFSQAMNWIRSRPQGRARTWSSFKSKR